MHFHARIDNIILRKKKKQQKKRKKNMTKSNHRPTRAFSAALVRLIYAKMWAMVHYIAEVIFAIQLFTICFYARVNQTVYPHRIRLRILKHFYVFNFICFPLLRNENNKIWWPKVIFIQAICQCEFSIPTKITIFLFVFFFYLSLNHRWVNFDDVYREFGGQCLYFEVIDVDQNKKLNNNVEHFSVAVDHSQKDHHFSDKTIRCVWYCCVDCIFNHFVVCFLFGRRISVVLRFIYQKKLSRDSMNK